MRIVIVGGGVVGLSLGEHLLRDKHQLSLIEVDSQLCDQLGEKLDAQILNGPGTSPTILKEAGLPDADMVLAVTPSDEVNMLVCAIAAQYDVKHRIARLRSAEFAEGSDVIDLARLGVTSVIYPEKVLADQIMQFVETPHAIEAANFEQGRILLRGFKVTEEMELANKTPRQIREEIAPVVVLFSALIRNGTGVIPDGATVIEPGDTLYALFPRESLDRFRKLIGIETKNRKIIMTGDSYSSIELAKLLVSVAAAFVVPGLGGAIGSLVNRVPASASTGIHAIALGLQSQAGNIASAIGEVGKSAAGTAITNALSARPRDFLNALVQGFAVTKDQIVTHVTGNITNRATLPDEDLWVYVSNWDPLARTISQYALEIRDRYDRYVAQVVPIGPMQRGRRSTLEQDRPYAVQIGIVWVRHSSGPVLVQAVVHNGQLRFSRFIDADMKDLAIERARRTQPRGIQTISWGPPHIFNMPSSVPRTAARR